MADIKISQLGAAASVGDSDVFPIVQDGVTVKASIGQVKGHSIGNTDISDIGDGTVTGAISSLDVTRAKRADIATVETSTASKTYYEGDQFYLSGVLYEALTQIDSGTAWSSLTLDTDYKEADNVTSQIQTLANKDTEIEGEISDIDSVISANGAKNLLPNRLTTRTDGGITFTVNSDGSVTCQGTLTDAYAGIRIYEDATHGLKSGLYHLSGCPSNATDPRTCLNIWDSNSDVKDTGNGIDFEIAEGRRFYVSIIIYEDLPTPITFKPMLTLADQPNSDYDHYVPYAKTNRELTDYLIEENISITPGNNTAFAGNFVRRGSVVLPSREINFDATADLYVPNVVFTLSNDKVNGKLIVYGEQYFGIIYVTNGVGTVAKGTIKKANAYYIVGALYI